LQALVLPTKPGELDPFFARETGAFAFVDLGLSHPGPHRRLTEVEISSHLANTAIAALTALNDLSFELRCERPTGTGLLPFHGLHFGHPFRGCAPDGGCPSNRWKPIPRRDKYLAAFERWSVVRLQAVEDPDDRQLIRTYLRWHIHRRLRERAETGALHESTTGQARQQTNTAVHFLGWLHARGRALADCQQRDVDDWFAAPPTTRWATRGFLVWAISHRHCPRLKIPYYRGATAPALSRAQLVTTLRRLLDDDTIELGDRVAGLLVLLFAQPVARIRSLTVSDLEQRDDELWLHVGAACLPLPERLALLITELITKRRNMDTGANPDSSWLFPGLSPGQPIQARNLAERLAHLGVTRLRRLAALKQLVSDVPAPVLGCSSATAPGSLPDTRWTRPSIGTTTPGSKLGMDRTDNENMRRWIMRLHQYARLGP